MKFKLLSMALALILVFIPGQTVAEMSSASYRITSTVISGGGAPMASVNYQMNGTLGQSTPLMEQGMDPYSDSYGLLPGFWYTIDFSSDSPTPDIKANESDGPLELTPGELLSITIALDPGIYDGYPADWWVLADAPFGWYYYDSATEEWLPGFIVSHQGTLGEVSPPLEVLNKSDLPVGSYTFYFGVDGWRNGRLDEEYLYYNNVEVNIAP